MRIYVKHIFSMTQFRSNIMKPGIVPIHAFEVFFRPTLHVLLNSLDSGIYLSDLFTHQKKK